MLKPFIESRLMSTALLAAFMSAGFLAVDGRATAAEEPKYKGTVLDQVDLGEVEAGEKVLKMTVVEMQPGAEIPAHTHKGPGLRYVLEGAVAIAWKDRGMQTFEAGSTYFESAGENHPPEEMSAKNMAEGTTRILIVELLSGE